MPDKLDDYLDVAPAVAAALQSGKPVVALESTIISHGMPYPRNVETAMVVEDTVRQVAPFRQQSPSAVVG